ncbi:hypothetical protein JD844_015253 [Phrynosoma platyrhinos]|uniref:LisH domain-containing protein n=1 Tax=Phrynosoma platyrhinos TaxID=52577 RepID=A0ABQ7T7N3_PHRPL|nr:hypothetical protein JD844_015253 [Phrynosoma platyrhinos]
MADLEAVLADVSYLMAMEKSKSSPAARASKKIVLPEPSIRSVMQKYLEERGELTFDKIFSQKIADHERFQRPSNHRKRRIRGGLRLPKSGHRENVRNEMFG